MIFSIDYPLYYEIKDLILENQLEDFNVVLETKRNFSANALWITFISNHDNYRSLSLFKENVKKWKQATLLQFLLHGTPMIYYGDEMGITGKILRIH